MKKRITSLALLLAALFPQLGAAASAQELSVRYEKRFQRPSVAPTAFGEPRGHAGRRTAHGPLRLPYRPSYLHRGRVWIPGGYALEARSEWVPGRVEQVWVEPVYELRLDSCGREVRVLVAAGHYEKVHRPGYTTTRYVRVWRPGHWSYRRYS